METTEHSPTPEMDTNSKKDRELIEAIAHKYNFVDPNSAKRFSSGQINRVYEIDSRFILKIKGERVSGLDLFNWQSDILNQIHDRGGKVPVVLGHENIEDQEYLLMEKMPGKILSHDWLNLSEAQRESLTHQLAEQLKIFHSVNSDHYAVPIVTGRPYTSFRPAVADITDFSDIDRSKLSAEYLTDLEYLENFFQDKISLLDEEGTAVPVHHDVNLENILWENDQITGIIDVDWMCYAPADYELKRIIHYARTPKYGVEEGLEAKFEGHQMTQEVKWLKQFYPELFAANNLADRIRLYLVDELLRDFRGYTSGEWSENVMKECHQLVQDYYQNDWLPSTLGK